MAGRAESASDIAASVDGERLWQRLMELARHGGRPDGGVDRPALSQTEIAARHQLIAWGRAAGLTAFTDGLANLFLRLEGREPDLAPVMAGSHIDSQPTGGKFDGTFGVLAALEAVEAMRARGVRPKRAIEVVAWTNEEASRFAPGMMGSEAFTGRRDVAEILAVTDSSATSVADAVAGVLAADPDVPRRDFLQPVAAFIEPHIEQGPVLERAGVPVGVVSGIQGTRRYRVRVTGEAAHAGTTPRAERRDALLSALRIIRAVDSLCESAADTLSTVGMFNVQPNAPSVVPGEAYFSLDVRQRDNDVLDHLGSAIPAVIEQERGACSVDIREIAYAPSVEFDEAVQSCLRSAAAALAIPFQDIYSAAGHDARHLAYHCPTAMLFVPCRDGISHNPAEHAEPEHLTAGARVLAHALWDLANDQSSE